MIALTLLSGCCRTGATGSRASAAPTDSADVEAAGAVPSCSADLEREDDRRTSRAPTRRGSARVAPGSWPERKRTVDLGGAVKLIEACNAGGAPLRDRQLDRRASTAVGRRAMRPYLEAKAEADRALMASRLDWTIVLPRAADRRRRHAAR